MKTYKLIGAASHPEDLNDGRVLGPNDEVRLTKEQASHPHNLRLIEEGLLVTTDDSEPEIIQGDELKKRAKELKIEGYSNMDADTLRKAIAEKEAEGGNS